MPTLKLKEVNGSTLWDFLDAAGTTNPHDCACDLRYLAWAGDEPELVIIQSNSRDGGWLGRSREPLKTSTHVFHLSAATKDNLVAGYNALKSALKDGRGKYFEYKLDGATETMYLDFLRGWTGALVRDEDSTEWVERRIRDVNLPVTILHQPTFRLDEIDAALNKLTNATLLCDENNDGIPEDWGWESSTFVTNQEISDGWAKATIGTTSARKFRNVVTVAAVPGDVFTGSYDVVTDHIDGRARIDVEFLNSSSTVIATAGTSLVTPSTDPNSPTRPTITTSAAPALTAYARLVQVFQNVSASAVGMWRRNANLSRTNSDPTFRSGVETINNDPASTTSGQRARVFVADLRSSDGPVNARLKLQGNGASYGEPVRVAAVPLSHPADFEKWLNRGKFHNLGGATLSNGATAVADGSGSGSGTNAINIPGASATNLTTKFATVTVTPSTYGLRGPLLLVPRFRATVANDDWSLKIIWGMDSGTPTRDLPIMGLTDLSSTFTEEQMGTINLLDDADPFTLKFDIYARRDSGTGDLRLNIFSFLPQHQISTLRGSGALVGATDYVVSDPGGGGPPEKFNSSDQFLDFIQVTNGTRPFVLEPELYAIYVADELGNLTGTIKASLVFPPTRHA